MASVQRPDLDLELLTEAGGELSGELDLDEQRVVGGGQRGGHGRGRIVSSLVARTDLSGARFGPLELVDSVLEDVDLSNAVLQGVQVRTVELRNCRAIGLTLSADRSSALSVRDCQLDFASVHLEQSRGGAAFVGCSLREARLSGDLAKAVFEDCDLTGAEFRATGAKGCDLRGSTLTGAQGLGAMRGAVISLEQAVSIAAELAAELGLAVR
ncbi:hypothetical protein KALB_7511 [Kutzneria albida DSM 43870]|uniref:Pentapeptide repeat-containing protein n=1 Tax=Kutzneria albida DSM 43870 TaxID=1449976 RepID=W5WI49_9PSEU|nr:hypothetical protein KALB_7511 [Kutzneria albida DSM 43870]